MSQNVFVTPEGRLIWLAAFNARANPNYPEQKPRYQATAVFPRDADLSELQRGIDEVVRAKYPKGTPPGFRSCFKSWDEKYPGDPTFAGSTLISCWSETQPGVVGPDNEPIEAVSGDLYNGCQGRLAVNPYAYTKGSGGVNLGLLHIQKTGDDEAFGGVVRVSPQQVFGGPTAASSLL